MVTIYIEGGGDYPTLKTECRKAFTAFFEKAGFKGTMPRPIACGGRQTAYEMFSIACSNNQSCILLVDSESPVTHANPWLHLAQREDDKWQKPANATDDDCHLMVQCMESWFLCDNKILAAYFGKHFTVNALPQHDLVEDSPKTCVLESLSKATRKTTKKYDKGRHSFELLQKIDPHEVFKKSPSAKRFHDELIKRLRPAESTSA